jgi:hypothetical protein
MTNSSSRAVIIRRGLEEEKEEDLNHHPLPSGQNLHLMVDHPVVVLPQALW